MRAGTNAGIKYFVATATVSGAQNQAALEGLTYTEIEGVGAFPDYGRLQAVADYATKKGMLKGKGAPNFGGGDIECAYISDDAGQILLEGYAPNHDEIAIKVVHPDGDEAATTGEFTPTTDFLRGVIGGPNHPDGGDEDFRRNVYNFGINQYLRVKRAAVA